MIPGITRASALVALTSVVLAVAGCGGSRGAALPCSPQPDGHLCLVISHDGLEVTDVIAYLAASGSPLRGKTWRLVLASDSGTFPGRARHGDPPLANLASAYASSGGFRGFRVPGKVSSGTQLCVSLETLDGNAWQTQATPTGVCSTVS